MGNTIIQDIRTLYSATLDGLKTEAENKKLNDLTVVGSIPIMIIIILVFHILSVIAVAAFCTLSKKKTLEIQDKRKNMKNRLIK